MVDLKSGANPLFLREEELRRGIELMFYAYREFTSEPDRILEEIGFGRAHHRAIYFVGRYPGITISELLVILRITKQSLSRVLSQLLERGYVEQTRGKRDQRQRLLSLTESGRALETRLTDTQRRRFAAAYRSAGAEAVAGFTAVLAGIMDPKDLERVDRLRARADEEAGEQDKADGRAGLAAKTGR
ncbi:MAG: MarR family transcriptional regulator [Kiloniellales bacterium]